MVVFVEMRYSASTQSYRSSGVLSSRGCKSTNPFYRNARKGVNTILKIFRTFGGVLNWSAELRDAWQRRPTTYQSRARGARHSNILTAPTSSRARSADLGAGVGRALGVGSDRRVGVGSVLGAGLGVAVDVDVGVGLDVAIAVGVGEAVGVGIDIAPPVGNTRT